VARGVATFKQSDLTRALKGAKAAGLEVARIKIANDGTIEIDAGKPSEIGAGNSQGANEWDELQR
jgi:hypothetical protein